MSRKLKIGIVGLRMGQNHIDGYLTHPNAKIQAICDLNPDSLQKIGDQYDIDGRYTSYEEMLANEELDIVSIVTPNHLHKDMTILALDKGIHVLCEKPIGINSEEAISMHHKAEETGKHLMVNYSHRFLPQSVAIKQRIDDDLVGDIYSVSCRWLRDINGFSQFSDWFAKKSLSGGGALMDIGVHFLDKVLWLLDFPELDSVLASTNNHISQKVAQKRGVTYDVEDTVEAMVRFKNNTNFLFQVSWAANIAESNLIECRLLGTKEGILEQNINQGYTSKVKTFYETKGISYALDINHVNQKLCPSSMYYFVDSIINDKPNMANGTEAVTVMKLIEVIYESAQTGKQIFFDKLNP